MSTKDVDKQIALSTEEFKTNHLEYMTEYSEVTKDDSAEDFLDAFSKFDLDTDDCTAEAYDAGFIAGMKHAKMLIEQEEAKDPILYALTRQDILNVAEQKEIDESRITDEVIEMIVDGWSEGLNWWESTYDGMDMALDEVENKD